MANNNESVQSDIQSVVASRNKEYGLHGDFFDKAMLSQTWKSDLDLMQSWSLIASPDEMEAMHMIIHKISRLAAGNPHHIDSWRDIAGYAMLVVNRLEAESK